MRFGGRFAGVWVNASGNTPTAGGSNAAMSISTVGGNITYGGTGSIANLGTGNGLYAANSGTDILARWYQTQRRSLRP